jgi:hypothetical protein
MTEGSGFKTVGDAWEVLDRHSIPRRCAEPDAHCLPTATALAELERRNRELAFALNDLVQISSVESVNKESLMSSLLEANRILSKSLSS